jgi:ComF family protein
MFNDFISLFFPNVCGACSAVLSGNEEAICLNCICELPKTNYHKKDANPIQQIFNGRVAVNASSSFFVFKKDSRVQELIHQIKYKGNKSLAFAIGDIYAGEIKNAKGFNKIDVVIPVPLHKTKLKKRGFNQSEYFAKGLSNNIGAKANTSSLVRLSKSETQTKKSRYERWVNVEKVFSVFDPEQLENKHVLLVDDVITTGATLEACVNALIEVKNIKISIATIAYSAM